jgi:protein involved in polysaccharide export with SLBB domain
LITDAYRLADRGVFYSARADFEESLRIIAQARDGSLHDGDHEDFLAQALTALKEADDFLKLKSATTAGKRDEISHLITAHRTAILKDELPGAVSQGRALQRYYSLIHHHLLTACGREPIASAAMLGLGKVHAAMATETPSTASAAGAKAMVLYRTAIAADPANSMAANELGVALARYGHLEQARDVLQLSVAISPHRAAWRNLSVVHHQLGETSSAAQAHQRSLSAPITEQDLRREQEVLNDGTITVHLLGRIKVTAHTVESLQKELETKYKKYYKRPDITVTPIKVNTKLDDLRASVDSRFGRGGQGRQARVTPEGTIQLPAVESIPALGLTLGELKRELDHRYDEVVEGIEVTPVLVTRAPRYVYVLGEVTTSGPLRDDGPHDADAGDLAGRGLERGTVQNEAGGRISPRRELATRGDEGQHPRRAQRQTALSPGRNLAARLGHCAGAQASGPAIRRMG